MAFVYIHIPYCVCKCAYCDFYSQGQSRNVPQEYIDAIIREIKRFNVKEADSVYFGGGTPSLLSARQVSEIISAASPKNGAEITIEANPDTVTADKMQGFFGAGVNRVSLGVQTADNESLKRLGRIHTRETAEKALNIIKAAGFDNISGDIMLALPCYTTNEFDETLALLKNAGTTHISSYLLKIEPNTAFGKNIPANLPTDDEAAEFYLYAVKRLEQEGYAQYEISNFAKKGFESRHNTAYWNCENYIGIGAAAHSCMDNKRFFYPPDRELFIKEGVTVPDGEGNAQDYIMLRLRLTEGLCFETLHERFGVCFTQKQIGFLQRCHKAGYAVLSENKIYLTARGMLLQNSILAELLREC